MAAVSEDFEGYAVGTELTPANSIFTGTQAGSSPPPKVFGSPARGARSLSSYLTDPNYPPQAFGDTPGTGSINSTNPLRYSVGSLPGAHAEWDYLTLVDAWFYVGFLNASNYPVTGAINGGSDQQINLVSQPLTLRMSRGANTDPFRLYVQHGDDFLTLSQVVPQDTWFHLRVSNDAVGPLRVYFNGNLVYTGSLDWGQWTTATLDLSYSKWWYKRIGSDGDGNPVTVASYGEWHVYVDDVSYSNVVDVLPPAVIYTQVQPLRRFQRPGKQAVGGVPRLMHDNTRTASLRRGPSAII